jgi:hypothetical protein
MVCYYQILAEDDPTPLDCATRVVNKDQSMFLQLWGALDTKAVHEKLRRKMWRSVEVRASQYFYLVLAISQFIFRSNMVCFPITNAGSMMHCHRK